MDINLNITIIQTLRSFPEYLSGKDLVKLGLFSSTQNLYSARTRSSFIKGIKINKRRVLFPKAAVIQFLTNNIEV